MVIISQDRKKLISVKQLDFINIGDEWRMYCGGERVGIYSSEKKALKVMDMIHNRINLTVGEGMVFQMPQDDEVKA